MVQTKIFREFTLAYLFILISNIVYGAENLYFKNFFIQQGMSGRVVFSIIQDKDGFMWFGTNDGIIRYDGHAYDVFRHDPEDDNSISNSRVISLLYTRDNELWAGTAKGLNVYDPLKEVFIPYKAINDEQKFLQNIRINVLIEDSKNLLWIGTNNGLFSLNRKLRSISYYLFQKEKDSTFQNNIRTLYEDSYGTLWIGTENGLYSFVSAENDFKRYDIRSIRKGDPLNNLITSLHGDETNKDLLWVGTETGLYHVNIKTMSFDSYRQEDGTGLSNNAIKSIHQLEKGILLLGTDEGLNYFKINTSRFISYHHNLLNSKSIADDVIYTIYKNRDGIIFFGTNKGASYVNVERSKFDLTPIIQQKNGGFKGVVVKKIAKEKDNVWIGAFDGLRLYKADPVNQQYLPTNTPPLTDKFITSIYCDKAGTVWIGTTNGLNYYDVRKQEFVKVEMPDAQLALKYLSSISEDSEGRLWVNSMANGICAIKPHRDKQLNILDFSIKAYGITPLIYSANDRASVLIADKNDNIWIGSFSRGLVKFDVKNEKFIHFVHKKGDNTSLKSNYVTELCLSKQGTLWVGTNKGLCRYDSKKNSFTHVDIGHNEQMILSMSNDKDGNIWVMTSIGIIKYLVNEDKTIFFDLNQDVNLTDISPNCVTSDSTGRIFIGGYGGFISFNPSEIKIDNKKPHLHIIKLSINDQDIYPDKKYNGRLILKESIIKSKKIKLTSKENTFKLYFSLLNYTYPQGKKYLYKLDNFDQNWNSTTIGQNYAAYSNISPGNYIFKVKGLNNDGTWSEEDSLMIRILPPWWATWWAYLIYSGLTIYLIYIAYRIFSKTNKLSNELKIQKIEREKEEEINQIKLRFFTNISHEFRTPLTLILGPIETLLEKQVDARWKEQLLIMKANGERLLRLVNQILDFRKVESHKMTLELSYGDIVIFVRSIYDSFVELARKHNIIYDFSTTQEVLYTMFDKDKTEKILYNLISNAFNYTPEGGTISIGVSLNLENTPNVFSIAVSDNGLGIDVVDQQYIFERFYQGKNKISDQYKGTGIGLMLSKEFAELQKGSLTFESYAGKGSTFTFSMPVVEKIENQEIESVEPDIYEENKTIEKKSSKPQILVVEDSEDLLHYIALSLEDEYKVLLAKDGVEAWEIANRHQPDLIVSDLMMPNMNGVELCKKVKTELNNPIPFILLTAKQDEKSVYDSLECGADVFIVKPFSTRLLKLRIAKLIEKEKKMHFYYKNLILLSPGDVVTESQDEKLILKLVQIVENNLDNSEMNVEFLCNSSGISHQQVYRKIKSLTGLTVTKFIRTIRLKRAAQLLEDSKMNISEVMYLSGFSGHSYFSKCFVEQYGTTPKEYMEDKRK